MLRVNSTSPNETLSWKAAPAPLKAEIEELIRPYLIDEKTPPFSEAELAVMAIVCHDKEWLDKLEILH